MRILAAGVAVLALGLSRADTLDLSSASVRRIKRENPQQKRAADELELHLRLVAGTKVGEDGVFEFVFGRPEGEPAAAPFSWHAKREGSRVWFWGDDRGLGRRCPFPGSAFAVYEFFEHALGVVWVGKEDDDIVFTPGRKAELPVDWRIDRVYPFETAQLRRVPAEYGNRLRHAAKLPFRYGHAFLNWQKMYLKGHPEYFCLNKDGTRGLPERHSAMVKLCVSNEAVVDRIVANWESAGRQKYLNVCPNDGSIGYCHCENCLKLDAPLPGEDFNAHKTDRYLNFWNRIAAKARTIRPDVQLVTYAYSYYRFPPRRERIEHPDNMLFGMVPARSDDYLGNLEKWKAAGLRRFFLRPNYTCSGGSLPVGLERYLYDNYHAFLSAGSSGFDYDGSFRPSMQLEYYVLMRMIDRPEMGFDAIVDEFCSQYGAAAGVAKAYFARVRERADRGRAETDRHIRERRIDLLDDSGLAAFSMNGHTARDFEDDLVMLGKAPTSSLSPLELRRWRKLVKQAEGYPEALNRVCRRKIAERPIGPEGWTADFDAQSFQGWKTRGLKAGLAEAGDGSGNWAVAFETKPSHQIALWRQSVPVTPGGKYTFSFDVRLDEGVKAAEFWIVSSDKNRRDIARKGVKGCPGRWQTGAVDFDVPYDVSTLTLYFSVGPGGEGRKALLDNIHMKRVSKTKKEESK